MAFFINCISEVALWKSKLLKWFPSSNSNLASLGWALQLVSNRIDFMSSDTFMNFEIVCIQNIKCISSDSVVCKKYHDPRKVKFYSHKKEPWIWTHCFFTIRLESSCVNIQELRILHARKFLLKHTLLPSFLSFFF